MAMLRQMILRKVFELETGKSLQQFFDQWIFREGHPELKVDFCHDNHIVEIKIKQSQAGEQFEFPLEVEMAFPNRNKKIYTFKVRDRESVFQIPVDDRVEWFSVDPEFKILKTISMKAPKELLSRSSKKGIMRSSVRKRPERSKTSLRMQSLMRWRRPSCTMNSGEYRPKRQSH